MTYLFCTIPSSAQNFSKQAFSLKRTAGFDSQTSKDFSEASRLESLGALTTNISAQINTPAQSSEPSLRLRFPISKILRGYWFWSATKKRLPATSSNLHTRRRTSGTGKENLRSHTWRSDACQVTNSIKLNRPSLIPESTSSTARTSTATDSAWTSSPGSRQVTARSSLSW